MTDAQFMGLIALGSAAIAAVPPSIIAWSARRKAEDTSTKADTIIKKADDTDKKANTLIEETAKIHTLTNSTLSSTTAALAVANAKIEGLNDLVMSMVDAKKAADADASKRLDATALDRNGRLDDLATKVEEGTAVSLRIEEKAAEVAVDLARHEANADKVPIEANPGVAADIGAKSHPTEEEIAKTGEPGAAADASAQQTQKEKRDSAT